MEKTNVMRLLDASNIPYEAFEYDKTVTDGQTVAKLLNQNADEVFKTLVTVSSSNIHYVFVVPVNCSLNLKKAAKAAGIKCAEYDFAVLGDKVGTISYDFLKENDIWHNETPGASYQDNGFWFQVFCQVKKLMFYNKPFYMLRRDNPNSSVMSKGKVYCMCDEYDFIRNVIKKDKELEKKFAPLVALYRFNNYLWTLNRIADVYKQEFLVRVADDYKKIQANGELKVELFGRGNYRKIQDIMNDPVAYYHRNFDELSQNNNHRIHNKVKGYPDSEVAFFII